MAGLGLFNKSLPQGKIIHGYKIEKYPNGRYIKCLSVISTLPQTLAAEVFPDKNIEDIVKDFTKLDENMLVELFGKALIVIPEKALEILSLISEIPYEDLTDKLTPSETLDIVKAIYEVNNFESFFAQVKKIVGGWIPKK